MNGILIFSIGNVICVQAPYIMENILMEIYNNNNLVYKGKIHFNDFVKVDSDLQDGHYLVKLYKQDQEKKRAFVVKKITLKKSLQ